MSNIIRHSASARADLAEIWLFIAKDNVGAADRQMDRFDLAMERLFDFLDSGHARQDAGDDVRIIPQDRYLIIYRHIAAESTVVIERIVHGSRNPAGLFA